MAGWHSAHQLVVKSAFELQSPHCVCYLHMAALEIKEQIRRGILVCPKTHEQLIEENGQLKAVRAGLSYPMVNGVPFVCSDLVRLNEYLKPNEGQMQREYAALEAPPAAPQWYRLIHRYKLWVGRLELDDYGPPFVWSRSKAAVAAWQAVAALGERPDAVCIRLEAARNGMPPIF
jgi:uncharacterized protein YbaR (Trm112 family)